MSDLVSFFLQFQGYESRNYSCETHNNLIGSLVCSLYSNYLPTSIVLINRQMGLYDSTAHQLK